MSQYVTHYEGILQNTLTNSILDTPTSKPKKILSILDKTRIPRPGIKPESYTRLKIQLNTSKSYSTAPRNIILGKNKKNP